MDLGGETVSAYRPLPSDDQVFGRADIFRVGDFLLQFATWSGAPALGATHASEPDRVLWASVAGQGFLAAGVAVTSVAEAAATGHPVMRHLVLHYSRGPQVLGLGYEYLLGPDMLVAPLVDPGATTTVLLYLPAGHWRHLWTDTSRDLTAGDWLDVPAPIGQPAVFVRAGSPVETSLRQISALPTSSPPNTGTAAGGLG